MLPTVLPTLFLGHGGGPLPLLGHESHTDLIRTWAPESPVHRVLHNPAVKAIVVVSAHHETVDRSVQVMTDAQPSLLFDYGGFPPETYTYTLPNPGAPALATRVLAQLTAANIQARPQSGRGHDHGVFIPLLGLGVARHRPSLPVISVSLRGPGVHRPEVTSDHLRMGHALADLRSEGVLLVGSGNSIHGRCTPAQSSAYDQHLRSLAAQGPSAFERWAEHPATRVCHARPEHLLPLLVCAGAAPSATVEAIQHTSMGDDSSHFVFRG